MSHVTVGYHFQGQKVNSQSHQAALLIATLAHQAAAAVGVGNCCYVAVCLATQGASSPTGRRGAGAYHGGRPPTSCSPA